MDYVLYAIIGIAAGILGGIFGIGGGILIVPALVFICHFDQKKAAGTSLVALLGPVGLFAIAEYWKNKQVDLVAGGIIAVMFLGGAFIGAKIGTGADPLVLRRSFAIFLFIVSIYTFFK